MNDSLITNPLNGCDQLSNAIIVYSSNISKDLGITYGEFWVYLMFFIIAIIIYYIILCYLSIYKRNKYITSVYWISNIILFLFSVFSLGLFFMFFKYN